MVRRIAANGSVCVTFLLFVFLGMVLAAGTAYGLTPTTTTLSVLPASPSVLGQTVTFTATVSGTGGTPTGVVRFLDGSVVIGSALLNGLIPDQAQFATALLSVTSHSITAAYQGDSNFASSTTSSALSYTVGARSTSAGIGLSPTSVGVGFASTVTATLTDTATTGPTGVAGQFAGAGATLTTSRYGLTATTLWSGSVLVTGGKNGLGVLASAEVYAGGVFALLGSSLHTARMGHTATLLQNGTVLIVGGSSTGAAAGVLGSAEIYDPVAGTFTVLTNSLNTPRFGHTATLLANGEVLIAGGEDSSGTALTSVEVYNPSGQTFTNVTSGSLADARFGHSATLLGDEATILIAGGDVNGDAELVTYDATHNTVSSISTGNLTTARTGHTATLLPDGNVLITGGLNSSGTALDTVELYQVPATPDTSSNFVAVSSIMGSTRAGHAAALLNSALVLEVGGEDASNTPLSGAELYTPSFDPEGQVAISSSDGTDVIAPLSPGCTLSLTGTGAATCTGTVTPIAVNTSPRTITGTYTSGNADHSSSSGTGSLAVTKSTPTFIVASTSITYGTSSVVLTGTIAAGAAYPPSAETVSVTIGTGGSPPSGTGTIGANGAFSVTVTGTGTLLVAGSPYTITYSYAGDTNFNSASNSSTQLTVNNATPTFTGITSTSISYGTNSVALSGTIAAGTLYPPSGETITVTISSASGSGTIGANGAFTATVTGTGALLVAGSPYTIAYSYPGDANFNPASDSSTQLTVNKATPTFTGITSNSISFGISSLILSGTLGAGAVYPSSGETVSVTIGSASGSGTIGANGAFTVTVTGTGTLSVAGSPYTIAYSYAGDANFNAAPDSSTQLTVNKATPAFTGITSTSINYGINSVVLSGTLAAGTVYPLNGETITVTISSASGSGSIGANGAFTVTVTGTGGLLVAGSPYTIAYSYPGDSNFNSASNSNTQLTVNKATPAFTGITSTSISFGTNSVVLSGTIAAGTVYPLSGETITVTIGAGGSPPSGSGTIGANGAFTVTVTGTGTLQVAGSPYTIAYSYPGDANFNSALDSSTQLTVNKPTPAFTGITSTSITYGTSSVVLSGTLAAGTVYPPSGETISVTIGSASGSGTLGASGAFTVTVTGTGALPVSGSPYTIAYSYPGDANFNAASDSSTRLTVNKATPVFTGVTSTSISYGTNSVALSGTIAAGTLDPPSGETITVTISSASGSGTIGANGAFTVTVTGTGALLVAGSPYTIAYSYPGDPNFNSASNSNTQLTVNKATPIFSVASSSIIYGTNSVVLSGILAAGTAYPSSGETITVAIGTGASPPSGSGTIGANGAFTVTVTGTGALLVAGSPYTIAYTYAGDANFNAASNSATQLMINPAVLTVTANSFHKTYGITYTPSGTEFTTQGLVNGNSVASVTLTCSGFAGTATLTAPGPAYSIVPTAAQGTGLGNYAITYDDGTLTVDHGSASVTPNAAAKVYGQSDPALTGTVSGFTASDNVTATYTRAAGESVANGPYTISATLSPASVLANYNITYNTANFVITPATPTITMTFKASSDFLATGTFTPSVGEAVPPCVLSDCAAGGLLTITDSDNSGFVAHVQLNPASPAAGVTDLLSAIAGSQGSVAGAHTFTVTYTSSPPSPYTGDPNFTSAPVTVTVPTLQVASLSAITAGQTAVAPTVTLSNAASTSTQLTCVVKSLLTNQPGVVPTCAFDAGNTVTSVTLPANGSAPVTVYVFTTSGSVSTAAARRLRSGWAIGLGVPALLLLPGAFARPRSRRRKIAVWLGLALILAMLAGLVGCGGSFKNPNNVLPNTGFGSATTSDTYAVMVLDAQRNILEVVNVQVY
jgi:hypothetical protein